MRKERQTASGGPGALHRIGALGVLLSGALVATVIMVASRVPPDPVDNESIPGVVIRTPARGTEEDPGDRRVRRARAGERGLAGSRADRPHGGARTLSRAGTGGHARKAVARPDPPPAEQAPEQPAPRSGGDDDEGPPPGAGRPDGDEEDGEARAPGMGQAEGDDDEGDDPPAPPAPAQPTAGTGAPADDDDDDDDGLTPSLSGTARLDDDASDGIDSGEGDD